MSSSWGRFWHPEVIPYCFSFIFLINSSEIKPRVLIQSSRVLLFLSELKASIQYIGIVYVF